MSQHENEKGFEKSDANIRPILQFGVVLVVLVAVSLVISYWLDDGLTPEPVAENQYAPKPKRVAETSWPELQSEPYAEIAEHRRREERRLTRYEWIDRQNGVARIPIARAMAIFLEREATRDGYGEDGEGGQ